MEVVKFVDTEFSYFKNCDDKITTIRTDKWLLKIVFIILKHKLEHIKGKI